MVGLKFNPKKRFGLSCYDKSICQREGFCKEVDKIVREHVYTPMGVVKSRSTIHRQQCDTLKGYPFSGTLGSDKDCERRVNLDDVPINICIKAKCEFVRFSGIYYCQKHVDECKVKGKRTPFQFPKGLHTPSADRAFYGNKRLDGKGFL